MPRARTCAIVTGTYDLELIINIIFTTEFASSNPQLQPAPTPKRHNDVIDMSRSLRTKDRKTFSTYLKLQIITINST